MTSDHETTLSPGVFSSGITVAVSPRKAWAAALLTLPCIGLGHLYAGSVLRGAALFLLQLPLAWLVMERMGTFLSAVTGMSVLLAFVIGCMVDAALVARGQQHYVLRPYNRRLVYVGVVLLGIVVSFVTDAMMGQSGYESFRIPSGSMKPTLLVGDRFIARMLPQNESVSRGEIVVFKSPSDGDVHFVKRVLGLPGETVFVHGGRVWINGAELDDPHARFDLVETPAGMGNYGPVTLGENEYWVMGDNRGSSMDSRYYGPIRRERMEYRPLYLYWAIPDMQTGERAGRFGMLLNPAVQSQ